jgi:uncharacterized damage-inducible protein DinB
MTERERLALDPLPASDAEIGRWLAAFEEVRRDTLRVLAEIPPDAVDREPADGGDTVGTILYHIALIEIDWVYVDVLGRDRGADIPRHLFPFDDRVEDDHLTPVLGEPLQGHLDRLAATRSLALDELRALSPEGYHRTRTGESGDVAADWVVFHLIDHEVEHRVRLSTLRDLFRPT